MPHTIIHSGPTFLLFLQLLSPLLPRWWEKEQRQPTPDEFHAHAVREMQQWRDCVAAVDVATCVRRYQPQQLVKGMYSQFLQVCCLQWHAGSLQEFMV
jgi:hypothetical protein